MILFTLYQLIFSILTRHPLISSFFFFNDTATTEIYTLSLHDALPIRSNVEIDVTDGLNTSSGYGPLTLLPRIDMYVPRSEDRKSTGLNSSHSQISYAVFCLKKKKK